MLAPDGGLGLMVYGELRRTGVYPARDLLRLVAPAERRDTQRPATARRLLASLQPTNRLRRNDLVATIWRGGRCRRPRLAAACPRPRRPHAATVALIAGAGLRTTGFVAPVRQDPAAYLTDRPPRDAVTTLNPVDRPWTPPLMQASFRMARYMRSGAVVYPAASIAAVHLPRASIAIPLPMKVRFRAVVLDEILQRVAPRRNRQNHRRVKQTMNNVPLRPRGRPSPPAFSFPHTIAVFMRAALHEPGNFVKIAFCSF